MSVTPSHENVLTLDSLLMRTDPLERLLPDTTAWTTIAGKLRSVFLTKELAPYVIELCTAYYASGKKRFVHDRRFAGQTDQVAASVDFLETFMAANGQWPCITRQPWYTSGDYVIAVDVNYYPDRSGAKASPVFHKDTGGNNIFVNLVFDNQQPIEATEWFADLAQPSAQRARWQEKLLPPEHLKELQAARDVLAPLHRDKDVSGGVAKGKNIFVSWVDDLVWHSTPTTSRRMEFTVDLAVEVYKQLNASVDKDFYYYHAPRKTYISALEVLGSMAECPTTAVHRWLAERGYGPQDITDRTAPLAWTKLYRGTDGEATFRADATERARTRWRVTGAHTEATAKDTKLSGSETINETSIGLSGRARANSVDPDEVEQVRKANEGVPRSFLRSWVRILPRDSQELKDSKVVFANQGFD